MLSASIQTQSDFLGPTDHHTIRVDMHILDNSNSHFPSILLYHSLPTPCLVYPGPASKSLFEDFADHINHDVEQNISFQCNIDSMESFEEQYHAFSHILTQAANDIFHCKLYNPHQPYTFHLSSPEIQKINSSIHSIGGLIFHLHHGPLPSIITLPF